MSKTQVANFLCRRLPLPLRARVLEDDAFASLCVPLSRTILNIGETITIDQLELFAVARSVLTDQETQTITDLNGHEISVEVDEAALVFKQLVNQELTVVAKLSDLTILSPRREDRSLAVNRLLDCLGPTAPDFSALQRAVDERELNDLEAATLLDEASTGVAAIHEHVISTLQSGPVRLNDLVPDSLLYFERFCGPERNDLSPEEYFASVLIPYRKKLLHEDLHRGLGICLLGGLRDDLSPVAWLQHLNDDDVWNALVACNPWHDPFSLLSALDIAVSRQHDQRYRDFAGEALNKLLEDKFKRSDSVDGYELLSLLIQVSWNRINMLEGGSVRSPYWKRMCSWMQGGFLLSSMQSSQINLDPLTIWAQSIQETAGTYARSLDLRREPMYAASVSSSKALRQEIIGRLVLLRDRHQAAGRLMTGALDIDEAVARLSNVGLPLGWLFPGPLEGHRLTASYKGRTLSENDVEKLVEKFSTDPGGSAWSMLAYVSQVFNIGDGILKCAREACSKINFAVEHTECEKQLGRLLDGCLVAAAQRDMELARSITTPVLARIHETASVGEAISVLHILLVASAAFVHEAEWAIWIEEQLAELTARLPAGEITKAVLEHLVEIKRVVPLTLPITSRAEAIALAS